jgi:hypothetical protein
VAPTRQTGRGRKKRTSQKEYHQHEIREPNCSKKGDGGPHPRAPPPTGVGRKGSGPGEGGDQRKGRATKGPREENDPGKRRTTEQEWPGQGAGGGNAPHTGHPRSPSHQHHYLTSVHCNLSRKHCNDHATEEDDSRPDRPSDLPRTRNRQPPSGQERERRGPVRDSHHHNPHIGESKQQEPGQPCGGSGRMMNPEEVPDPHPDPP